MPVERIYLHVGLPKTGSTTIQHTLFQNRASLQNHGITYWDYSPGHARPLHLAFEVGELTPMPGDKRYESPEQIRRHLATAIVASKQKFVLSAEGLGNLTRAALPGFKDFLAQFCQNTRVIAYVRDPVSLYHSAVQQHLKTGKPLADAYDVGPAYRSRIEPLMHLYGKENVVLRRYGTDYFVDGDLMSDFFSAIDEPTSRATECSAVERHNTSLSHRAVMVLDALNRVPQEENQATGWLAKRYLKDAFPGSPFRAPAECVERMLANNKDDIAWMSEQLGAELTTTVFASSQPGAPPSLDDVAKLAVLLKSEVERLRNRLRRQRTS